MTSRQSLAFSQPQSHGIKQQQEAYSFPLLKFPEIAQFLSDSGISTSQTELSNPSKNIEKHTSLFETLAIWCTGVTPEEISPPAPQLRGLSSLGDYPELHDHSIRQLNLFRVCSKMMEACCADDFCLKDLIDPNPKSLRIHLSAIINFLRFREEKYGILEDFTAKNDELKRSLEDLTDRNQSLHRQKKTLEDLKADMIISQIESDINTLGQSITEMNTHQAEIREENARLKSHHTNLKESIASKSIQLDQERETKRHLSGQIVNSPDRFRKQIGDVRQALQNEQKDAKSFEDQIRVLSAWLISCRENQEVVNMALLSVQDLQAEVERQRAATAELAGGHAEVASRREALQEMDQNVHLAKRQAQRSDEKLQHLRKQISGRSADSTQAVEDLQMQLREAENLRAQVCKRAEKLEAEYVRVERENEVETRQHEQEIKDMIGSYQRLERVVVSHLQSLRQIVESAPPANFA